MGLENYIYQDVDTTTLAHEKAIEELLQETKKRGHSLITGYAQALAGLAIGATTAYVNIRYPESKIIAGMSLGSGMVSLLFLASSYFHFNDVQRSKKQIIATQSHYKLQ